VESAVICVSPEGIIEWVEKDIDKTELEKIASSHGLDLGEAEVTEFGQGEFLVNGMVDTHTVSQRAPFFHIRLILRVGIVLIRYLACSAIP
jgi:hypothetical protein